MLFIFHCFTFSQTGGCLPRLSGSLCPSLCVWLPEWLLLAASVLTNIENYVHRPHTTGTHLTEVTRCSQLQQEIIQPHRLHMIHLLEHTIIPKNKRGCNLK